VIQSAGLSFIRDPSFFLHASRRTSEPWRRGEVKVELLFLGISNERPVVGESVFVVTLQPIENDPASLA
jgi:hypothetical protein